MTKSELQSLIKTAFKNVILDGGVSLRQAKVQDNYGRGVTRAEYNRLPYQEITEDWTLLTADFLEEHTVLAHLDSKGFRYYIPAFMLVGIDAYDTAEDILLYAILALYPKKDSLWDHHMSHYKLLNSAQREAVALFLHWLPDILILDVGETRYTRHALKNFWHKYLPSPLQELYVPNKPA